VVVGEMWWEWSGMKSSIACCKWMAMGRIQEKMQKKKEESFS